MPNRPRLIPVLGSYKAVHIQVQTLISAGVRVMYQRHPTERTGSCAALITGHDRSLVTSLGAALKFSHKFMLQEENWKIVEKAEVIYIGGFTFDVSIQ